MPTDDLPTPDATDIASTYGDATSRPDSCSPMLLMLTADQFDWVRTIVSDALDAGPETDDDALALFDAIAAARPARTREELLDLGAQASLKVFRSRTRVDRHRRTAEAVLIAAGVIQSEEPAAATPERPRGEPR